MKASVHSDASGRAYAGMVNIPYGPCSVTAGEFTDKMLSQDIQVKEGEALRATISMIVSEMPSLVQGKTLVCHIDNQALKAVYERKGTSHNLELTDIGKKIYWLQRAGGFSVKLEYVQSEKMSLILILEAHLAWKLVCHIPISCMFGILLVHLSGTSWLRQQM